MIQGWVSFDEQKWVNFDERRSREPRFVTIERLAEALEVSPTRLFDGADDRNGKTGSEARQPEGRSSGALRRAAERCVRLLQAALKDE